MRIFERILGGRKEPAPEPQEEREQETAPEEFPLLAEKRRAYVDACNAYRRMFGKPPKESIIAGARRFVEAGDNERLNPLFYDEEAKQAKEETEERREGFHTKLFHSGIRDKDQRIILYDIELAKADYEGTKIYLARETLSKNYLTEAEIFQKFIIQEHERLAREELESWPPKEKGMVKKGLDWWTRQNKYVRLGVSTLAVGGLGYAGLLPIGSAGLAWFAGKRIVRGLVSFTAGHSMGKIYDKIISENKIENKKEQAVEELSWTFSPENFRDIESAYRKELEKAASKKRLRLLGKAAVMMGAGAGSTLGFGMLEQAYTGGAKAHITENSGKAGGAGHTKHYETPAEPPKIPQPEAPEPELSEEQKFYNNIINDPDFAKSQGWDGKSDLTEWAKERARQIVEGGESPTPPSPEETPAPEGTIGDDLEKRERTAKLYEEELKNNPDKARALGWDGKTDLNEFARRESRGLAGVDEPSPPSREAPAPSEEQAPSSQGEVPAEPSGSAPAPEEKSPAETLPSKIETARITIGTRGPEGALIDYLKQNPDLAKQYGWDGKTDISKWAGPRAHQLWQDYSKEALAKPETIKELKGLGYEPNSKGYAEMTSHIQKGSITLDVNTRAIQLDDMKYGRSHGMSYTAPPAEQSPDLAPPPEEYPDEYPEEHPEEYPESSPEPTDKIPSLHQEGVEILPPSTDRETAAVEVFRFNHIEYDEIKNLNVEDFLRITSSSENTLDMYEKLPIDQKNFFIKQIELAEYMRGFALDEHLTGMDIKEFLQTVRGTESLLEETIGREQAILSLLRFNAEQYGIIKTFSVREFLEKIPTREEAWRIYGSRTAVPEFLKKQIDLAEYIKSVKPNEGLKSLTVQEFLRSRTP